MAPPNTQDKHNNTDKELWKKTQITQTRHPQVDTGTEPHRPKKNKQPKQPRTDQRKAQPSNNLTTIPLPSWQPRSAQAKSEHTMARNTTLKWNTDRRRHALTITNGPTHSRTRSDTTRRHQKLNDTGIVRRNDRTQAIRSTFLIRRTRPRHLDAINGQSRSLDKDSARSKSTLDEISRKPHRSHGQVQRKCDR